MSVTTLDGRTIQVNEEGFLTDPGVWDEDLAKALAAAIGITLTEAHWKVIRFLRHDFTDQGETATLRRVSTRGGIPVNSSSRSSPRTRPRRWPISPVYPSRTAASDCYLPPTTQKESP